MHCRYHMMASTAFLVAWMLGPDVAVAQSTSDAEKIERLERQTELLQKQLKELQSEIASTRKKTGKVEAAQAHAVAAAPPPPPDKGPILKAPTLAVTDKVKVTVGGFIAAESVWRQRNEVA